MSARRLKPPAPLPTGSRSASPAPALRGCSPLFCPEPPMNKLHDPELELFKRTVDLAEYAKRAGYELRPQDGAPGLTVLDHPNRDRIVVGQQPERPVDLRVGARLHAAGARRAGGAGACTPPQRDRPLEGQGDHRRVRAAARCVGASRARHARPGHGIACAAFEPRVFPSTSRVRSLHRRTRAVASAPSNRAAIRCPRAARSHPNPELNRRRYDWSPPVESGPRETEVERRLRRVA